MKLAVAANPGAKPLGVKLRGGIYVVRLKQDGTIIQVGVDPATGDVFPRAGKVRHAHTRRRG